MTTEHRLSKEEGRLNSAAINKLSVHDPNIDNMKKKTAKTPKVSKTYSNNNTDDINRIDIESFDKLITEDESLNIQVNKRKESGKKKIYESKSSRFSHNNGNLNSGQSLSNLMPNFIKNYANLLEVVSLKSNNPEEDTSPIIRQSNPKKVKYKTDTIHQNDQVNSPKIDTIDSLVTIQEQKVIPTIEQNEENVIFLQSMTNTEEIDDFYDSTKECLKRIAKLKMTPEEDIQHLLITLPCEKEVIEQKKKLAIFDLDETIVHCEVKNAKKGEVQIQVKLPNGSFTKVGLNIRPKWRESLIEISKYYVIIVYTASHQTYADSVLDYLDPDNELIQYRLYRHNCVKVKLENDFIYVKDMRIFKNICPKDIIIIDNSVLSFAFQLDNGIPILPYYNNKEDDEFSFLTRYLIKIAFSDDLREENKKNIRMDFFKQAAIDESILVESVDEEAEVSIDKSYTNMNKTEKVKNLSSGGGFSLNICETGNSFEDSLDSSLNMSFNTFVKEDLNNIVNYKFSSHSTKFSEQKKSSIFQDQFLNTLMDLKKNLEENLRKSGKK